MMGMMTIVGMTMMMMNSLSLVGGTGSAQLTPRKTPHLVVMMGIWDGFLGFTGVSGLQR
jgi:hypothetical protein